MTKLYEQQMHFENDLETQVLEPWMNQPYGELSAINGSLIGLKMMTQSFHWRVLGKDQYGDHLLLQRIYETIDPFIDKLGEKAVGFGGNALGSSTAMLDTASRFNKGILSKGSNKFDQMHPNDKFMDMTEQGLLVLTSIIQKNMDMMQQKATLTKGLDNLLAGLLDILEDLTYLVGQRLKG